MSWSGRRRANGADHVRSAAINPLILLRQIPDGAYNQTR